MVVTQPLILAIVRGMFNVAKAKFSDLKNLAMSIGPLTYAVYLALIRCSTLANKPTSPAQFFYIVEESFDVDAAFSHTKSQIGTNPNQAPTNLHVDPSPTNGLSRFISPVFMSSFARRWDASTRAFHPPPYPIPPGLTPIQRRPPTASGFRCFFSCSSLVLQGRFDMRDDAAVRRPPEVLVPRDIPPANVPRRGDGGDPPRLARQTRTAGEGKP